jgi:hypothetical protein
MAGITTNMTNSFRTEILQAGHCFAVTLAQTGNSHTSTLIDTLTSTANLSVGMAVSKADVTGANVIVAIINSTALTISSAASGTAQGTVTFTGDVFKMALIKHSPTGTYDKTTTNYTTVTGNSDEVSGTGYAGGGFTLVNVQPTVPDSNTAIATFNTNPSWTTATIDADGCIIYNSSARISNTAGRATSVHDFGGEQKVTAGTFTVNLPAADGTHAILRIG